MQLKKIVIIGPESTGKSTLCKQLAEHYKTFWVPEYAREYLQQNGMNYTYEDLLKIAKGQIATEEMYTDRAAGKKQERSLPHLLFIDTNMYVMKVWCEFVFQKTHDFILEQLSTRKYDLYLLCNVDLPWVNEELREYPDIKTRKQLYDIYQNLMETQDTPWFVVSGNYDERLRKAIEAVDKMTRESMVETI